MYPPFIFIQKLRIYWRHGAGVSDDITTTKAIRRVNDKIFGVLILLCQQGTQNKTICEKNLFDYFK